MTETSGVLFVSLLLFGVILGILWLILPFTIFSLNSTVRRIAAEQKATNELLRDILTLNDVARKIGAQQKATNDLLRAILAAMHAP